MPSLRSVALTCTCFAAGAPAQKVFHTVERALRLAFGEARVERTTETLSTQDRTGVEQLTGAKMRRSIVFPYVARKDGAIVGTAYFDTHRVRTLRETVMVVLRADGRIAKVVVCAFAEPVDYKPRDSFYAQFEGRRLDDDLRLRRGIDGVSGATLTSSATTDCVRRVLAIHGVLEARRAAEREEKAEAERKKQSGGEPEKPPERRPGKGGEPPAIEPGRKRSGNCK